MNATAPTARSPLLRRAIRLEFAVIAYNIVECVISLAAGIAAGSVALIGFGLDAGIEISASVAVLLHLWRNADAEAPEWEHRVAVFVGLTLIALAIYVGGEAIFKLAAGSRRTSLISASASRLRRSSSCPSCRAGSTACRTRSTAAPWKRSRAKPLSAPGSPALSCSASARTLSSAGGGRTPCGGAGHGRLHRSRGLGGLQPPRALRLLVLASRDYSWPRARGLRCPKRSSRDRPDRRHDAQALLRPVAKARLRPPTLRARSKKRVRQEASFVIIPLPFALRRRRPVQGAKLRHRTPARGQKDGVARALPRLQRNDRRLG